MSFHFPWSPRKSLSCTNLQRSNVDPLNFKSVCCTNLYILNEKYFGAHRKTNSSLKTALLCVLLKEYQFPEEDEESVAPNFSLNQTRSDWNEVWKFWGTFHRRGKNRNGLWNFVLVFATLLRPYVHFWSSVEHIFFKFISSNNSIMLYFIIISFALNAWALISNYAALQWCSAGCIPFQAVRITHPILWRLYRLSLVSPPFTLWSFSVRQVCLHHKHHVTRLVPCDCGNILSDLKWRHLARDLKKAHDFYLRTRNSVVRLKIRRPRLRHPSLHADKMTRVKLWAWCRAMALLNKFFANKRSKSSRPPFTLFGRNDEAEER